MAGVYSDVVLRNVICPPPGVLRDRRLTRRLLRTLKYILKNAPLLTDEQLAAHPGEFERVALCVALTLALPGTCAGYNYEEWVETSQEDPHHHYVDDFDDFDDYFPPGCTIGIAHLPCSDAFSNLAGGVLAGMPASFVCLVKELMPASAGKPEQCSECNKEIRPELVHFITYNKERETFTMRPSSLSVIAYLPCLVVCKPCGEGLMCQPHKLDALLPLIIL